MSKEKKVINNKKLIKLNMTFEQAMKKSLNTPLPTKRAKKRNN